MHFYLISCSEREGCYMRMLEDKKTWVRTMWTSVPESDCAVLWFAVYPSQITCLSVLQKCHKFLFIMYIIILCVSRVMFRFNLNFYLDCCLGNIQQCFYLSCRYDTIWILFKDTYVTVGVKPGTRISYCVQHFARMFFKRLILWGSCPDCVLKHETLSTAGEVGATIDLCTPPQTEDPNQVILL